MRAIKFSSTNKNLIISIGCALHRVVWSKWLFLQIDGRLSIGCALSVDAFEIDASDIDALDTDASAGLFAFDCGMVNRRCSERVIQVTHVTNQACDRSMELA